IPFFLDFVGMAVPGHVATLSIGGAKDPGALVPNLVTSAIVPGSTQRVSSSFYLLMRSNIDGAIGVEVVVGAGGNTAGAQIGTGIRHRGVERVAAKVAVVSAECGEAALATSANILPLSGEDKENFVDARGPAVHLLGMRDFGLNLCILQRAARV